MSASTPSSRVRARARGLWPAPAARARTRARSPSNPDPNLTLTLAPSPTLTLTPTPNPKPKPNQASMEPVIKKLLRTLDNVMEHVDKVRLLTTCLRTTHAPLIHLLIPT